MHNKVCKEANCLIQPVYGLPKYHGQKKYAEYCKSHAPAEYIDIVK